MRKGILFHQSLKVLASPMGLIVMSAAMALLNCSHSFAAVSVQAEFESPVVHPSEVIRYIITINSNEGFEASVPDLRGQPDFSVMSNSEASSTSSTLAMTAQGPQFQTQIQKRFIFELEAKRTGTLRIEGLEIEVGSVRYKVPGAQVKVDANHRGTVPQNPGVPYDPGDEVDDIFSQLLRQGIGRRPAPVPGRGARTLPINPDEAFFIQVEADKTEAYVGEQVTVSFYLYTTGLIRDLDTLKYPSLKGFWKEDIEIATHLNYQSEVVNGVAYKKALLASFALFPIKEGRAEIDSYKAKCTVIPGDPFGSFGKAYTYTKASLPIKIQVKPLPTTAVPSDFVGAVGDFQISSRVDDRQPVQHQPFALKVRFEGKGNAKLVELPSFNVPEGLELYDTQKEARFYANGLSYKEFTLLLIPRRSGDFQIPPFAASLFDPVTGRFINRKTEPIVLSVLPGTIGAESAKQYGDSGSQQSNTGSANPPKWMPTRLPVDFKSSDWIYSTASAQTLWLYLVAGLLSVGIGVFYWNLSKRPELLRARVKRKMTAFEAALSQNNVRSLGTEALNLLAIVLSALAGSRLSDREIRRLIQALPPGIVNELGVELERAVERAEVYAFSPQDRIGAVAQSETQSFAKDFRALLDQLLSLAEGETIQQPK